MPLYPLFAQLERRRVLVVGGGAVAERKVAALLAAGAQITVVAPELTTQLACWLRERRLAHRPDEFCGKWLDGAWLAVAATGSGAVNAAVAAAANERHVFVNVVDDAQLSSFHIPAVVDRAPLTVAISSGGAAPMLARRVRARLETLLDESLGPLTLLLARYRARILRRLPDLATRRRFYDAVLDGPVAALLRRQRVDEAEHALSALLTQRHPAAVRGRVSLVGAGPGDPGLLTLHALRALQQADVILHDRLISAEVLALARRDAQCIDVGKRCGGHTTTQADIHELLLDHARAGRHVVRLKGGDPFVFGRGGEELEFLRAHDIDYDVVPGITAAIACAAYAGIPLTHRTHAQSVRFVTAHCKDSLDTLDWSALAREGQTLAVYMGVGELEVLTARLLAHGRAASTPFALIENGTRADQRVMTGTLGQLPARARAHTLHSPALLILGAVAALAEHLHWFGAPALTTTAAMPMQSDTRTAA